MYRHQVKRFHNKKQRQSRNQFTELKIKSECDLQFHFEFRKTLEKTLRNAIINIKVYVLQLPVKSYFILKKNFTMVAFIEILIQISS